MGCASAVLHGWGGVGKRNNAWFVVSNLHNSGEACFAHRRWYGVSHVHECCWRARTQEGYAALGSFIDGDNSEGARFAYTQPVVMRYAPDVGVWGW